MQIFRFYWFSCKGIEKKNLPNYSQNLLNTKNNGNWPKEKTYKTTLDINAINTQLLISFFGSFSFYSN